MARAQKRTENNINKLATALKQLTKAQTRTEKQLERFERATEKRFESAEKQLQALSIRVDKLVGSDLERRYRERAHAYFSRMIRRAHILFGDELSDFLEEAVGRGRISEAERDELFWADLIVSGRRREDDSQVCLVVEVSWIVDPDDVERACRRAQLLTKAGVTAIPVVAGTDVTKKAMEMAHSSKVWQVLDGQPIPP